MAQFYVYSFGVVLLEIITSRKAIDNSKTGGGQNLVAWARPWFKDRRKFCQIADPALQGQYPARGLNQALAVAAVCVQEHSNMPPVIADVVTAPTYLASQKYDPEIHPIQNSRWSPSTPPRSRRDSDKRHNGCRNQDRSTRVTHILTVFCGGGLTLSIITGFFGISLDGILGSPNKPVIEERVEVRKLELQELVNMFQHDAETHAQVRKQVSRNNLT